MIYKNIGTVAELIATIESINTSSGTAEHIIILKPHTIFEFTDRYMQTPNALPKFEKDITIEGNHSIFKRDSPNNFRFIEASLSGVNLKLKHLVFFNGKISGSGGAVFLDGGSSSIGTLDVEHCLFYKNTATSKAGAVFLDRLENANILSSDFYYNSSGTKGGALDSDRGDQITIEGCTFKYNSADLGGAFEINTPGLLVCDSSFFGNTAFDHGGAINLKGISGQTITIQRCRFNDNSADNEGGAIYFYDPFESASFEECDFENNSPDAINNPQSTTVKADFCWWGHPTGPHGPAPYQNGAGDVISVKVRALPFKDGVTKSGQFCTDGSTCYVCEQTSGNPILLLDGQKQVTETDLSVRLVSAGALDFTRLYLQGKQATLRDILGLGWTHNHFVWLDEVDNTNAPNDLTVYKGQSITKFIETADGSNSFQAKPGSTSIVEKIPGSPTQYIMTIGDKSELTFEVMSDDVARLIEHKFPSGEYLTYVYDTNLKLETVTGSVRGQLQFYYNGDGLLYRVGDQTFTESPLSGRYVEFGYVSEKIPDGSGGIINGPDFLLASVRDVRDHTWTYDYYGQDTLNETDEDKLNFLVERFSPDTDKSGNGSVDGPYLLEKLTYTLTNGDITAITQERGEKDVGGTIEGLITNQFGFNPNPTGDTETTQTVDGVTTRFQFTEGIFLGTEDPLGNQSGEVPLPNHRPFFRQDKNGNTSWLAWDTEKISHGDMEEDDGWQSIGNAANKRISGTSVYEGSYSRNVDTMAADEGIESDVFRLVKDRLYRIRAQVFLQESSLGTVKMQLSNGAASVELSATEQWTELSFEYTPTVSANDITLQFLSVTDEVNFHVDDVSVKEVITGSVETGEASPSQLSSVTNPAGAKTAFGYDNQDRLLFSLDDDGRKTRYLYGDPNNPRQATQVKVFDTDRITLLQWQKFAYDATGNTILEQTLDPTQFPTEAVLQEVEREYYTSGNGIGLLKRVAQKDMAGGDHQFTLYFYDELGRLIQTNQNSSFGQCTRSRTVYDAAGNVVASICNFDIDLSQADAQSSSYADPGKPRFAVDEDPTTFWEANGGVGEWISYDFVTPRVITELTLTARDDAPEMMPRDFTIEAWDGSMWQTIQSFTLTDAWLPGETRNFSLTNTAAYAEWRLVTDALWAGNSSGHVSLAELDFLAPNYPSTVAEAVALYNPSFPDRNRVTTYEYDELGRQIAVTVNIGSSEERTNLTIYDSLGRVVRTIDNYVDTGLNPYPTHISPLLGTDHSDFDTEHGGWKDENRVVDIFYNDRGQVYQRIDPYGLVTYSVYDDAGRQIRTVTNYVPQGSNTPDLWAWNALSSPPRWEDGAGNAILFGTLNDQNIISEVQYDANGNRVMTRDVLGHRDFFVYDSLNRVIKTVRRASDTATIDLQPGDLLYDPALDPRSAAYAPSTDPGRDLIMRTVYDKMGRVVLTQNEVGTWSLFGYDELGRQVRTIAGASQPYYDVASDPSLANYVISGAADEDILSETVYREDGRVKYTADTFDHQTWFAYDGLGRQVKTAASFTGTEGDLDDWVWDGQWETSGGVPVSHGDEDDENVISQTIYNADGRVESTRDVLGRVTRYVYDEQGRRVKTVSNYNGTSDPADWAWDGSQWVLNTTPINHGANADQNLITETIYDDQGRVESTRDTFGNVTRHVFFLNGLREATIRNYVPQGGSDPADWVWKDTAIPPRWEDGAGNPIDHGTNNDQNLITQTGAFDDALRVTRQLDTAGRATYHVFDALGRRVKVVQNYMKLVGFYNFPESWEWDGTQWADPQSNAISHGTGKDLNLISQTVYNEAGQVLSIRDTKGTLTTFDYDAAGRRIKVTRAAGSSVETTDYTVYDKAGRVVRAIQNSNYTSGSPAPHERDATGEWLYAPSNGANNDQDLSTEFVLDKLGRVIQTIDPAGNTTETVYDRDGRVLYRIDPLQVVTAFRYDKLRRLRRVVANYVNIGVDPASWLWSTANTRWEDGGGNEILHGTNTDTNIIAEVELDITGRKLLLRDPRGMKTDYVYDQLNRRTSLHNHFEDEWSTTYSIQNGTSQIVETNPLNQQTQRNFDRAGRLTGLSYLSESPKFTPDVTFEHDLLDNVVLMSETVDGVDDLRTTSYAYDTARRLTQVDLDRDPAGAGTPETVTYTYNVNGWRTKIELPGSQVIDYIYDDQGRLIDLNDWEDGSKNTFSYDEVGRFLQTELLQGSPTLVTSYHHDPAGHLLSKKVVKSDETLASFAYQVDARGNRTQAVEAIQVTSGTYTIDNEDPSVDYVGTWTHQAAYSQGEATPTEEPFFRLTVLSKSINLVFKTGPNRGKCRIFVNGQSELFDTYSPTAGEATYSMTPADGGPHDVLVRCKYNKNAASTGYLIRFKELQVSDEFDLHTIQYEYDALSRLLGADYYHGENLSSGLFREHEHEFDAAGNRTREKIFLNASGSPTVHNQFIYNDINQVYLVKDNIPATPVTTSLGYNAAGNLLTYGTDSFTWDRADRLLTARGVSYTYNGLGQRIGLNDGTAREFILDTQPGLYQVLRRVSGANQQSYVHGPAGILRRQLNDGTWREIITDGLGSVRQELRSDFLNPVNYHHYEPYGEIFDPASPSPMPYNFTGEPLDSNDLLHLRARYLLPELGVFPSLDPLEGGLQTMDALNRYAYVAGNPVNLIDPSGLSGYPCTQKTCFGILQDMFAYIAGGTLSAVQGITHRIEKGLKQRLEEMLEDKCFEYNLFANIPLPSDFTLNEDCLGRSLSAASFAGHLDAFVKLQQGRNWVDVVASPSGPFGGALEGAVDCYENKGVTKAMATGNTSELCDLTHSTYTATLNWVRSAIWPADIKPTRHGGRSEAPEAPPLPLSTSDSTTSNASSTGSTSSSGGGSDIDIPPIIPIPGRGTGFGQVPGWAGVGCGKEHPDIFGLSS